MKTLLIILLSLGLAGQASAATDTMGSRSAGKLHNNSAVDLAIELEKSDAIYRKRPAGAENYAAQPATARAEGVANRYDQVFTIFDADLRPLADFDGDGYHHAINVWFDVDVSVDHATVYAKLYLSREGGPWEQIFTTGLFEINHDLSDDSYEVETELLEGYPPGYYDVLLEIYSLDHAYMVTSEVLDHHYLGRDVLLEDLSWDEPLEQEKTVEYYEETVYVESDGGGGSLDLWLLLLLVIPVVIAARGSLAPPR